MASDWKPRFQQRCPVRTQTSFPWVLVELYTIWVYLFHGQPILPSLTLTSSPHGWVSPRPTIPLCWHQARPWRFLKIQLILSISFYLYLSSDLSSSRRLSVTQPSASAVECPPHLTRPHHFTQEPKRCCCRSTWRPSSFDAESRSRERETDRQRDITRFLHPGMQSRGRE